MISRSAFPGLCAPGKERWRVSEIFKPATFDSDYVLFVYRTNCLRVIISRACNLVRCHLGVPVTGGRGVKKISLSLARVFTTTTTVQRLQQGLLGDDDGVPLRV